MKFEEWLSKAERRRFELNKLVVPAKILLLPCGCKREKVPQRTRRGWRPDRSFTLIRVFITGQGIFWKCSLCDKLVSPSFRYAARIPEIAHASEIKRERQKCYFA